jgi:hypothetical protein
MRMMEMENQLLRSADTEINFTNAVIARECFCFTLLRNMTMLKHIRTIGNVQR